MTLVAFIYTIICFTIAVGATIGCLVFLYKSGKAHDSNDGSAYAGWSYVFGIIAAGAICVCLGITRNIVWTFII